MAKRLLPKHVWKNALGANAKAKRLHLVPDSNGTFNCPVQLCDSELFHSIRGCRKHVYNRHGWFYYFDVKPKTTEAFPETMTREYSRYRPKKSCTITMPSFLKTSKFSHEFQKWLRSLGGGGKSHTQANQIACKVLKFTKFCCEDVSSSWEVPLSVVDYCIGSVKMISEFVSSLQEQWKLGNSGIIGYMNALAHLLDYRRSVEIKRENIPVFISSEIYLDRVKKCLRKQMRIEWNNVLSIEYLESINCWATLEQLQEVIPYHGDKFSQILLNASRTSAYVPSHDLSFATSYVVAILFLLVKASRPMTYQYLTVQMLQNIDQNGIIDQTMFKTREKYGFDSLIFTKEIIDILNGYIACIRPRLNPLCDYLLLSRNGTQLQKLTDIFGRIVYLAIGKYINPTRYRQIVETESAAKLDVEERQALTEDQKHTSNVAKVHYNKQKSHDVAQKGKACMDRLRNSGESSHTLETIQKQLGIDFTALNNTPPATSNADTTVSTVSSNKTHENSIVRKRKVLFSKMEDQFIADGIKKHGKGRWTAILSDTEYNFDSARKVGAIATRAKTIGII